MTQPLKNILEAALMAAGGPLSLERMQSLFEEDDIPAPQAIRDALTELKNDLLGRGIELTEVASGFRFQVRTEVAPWVAKLWDERPQRYSRALLETLALIAYRQPITRGDIEDVRGVVVSSGIMKTLLEREWVRVVGHRDVPGRPAMYATTKEFLDYFGLKSLEDLPSLMEIRELDDANRKLELGDDAQARKEPDKEYEFRTDEEVAQRGADVLAETEDDLAAAKSMVDRVEKNLFHRDDDEEGAGAGEDGEKRAGRSIGDLLARLEKSAQEEAAENPPQDNPPQDKDDSGEAADSLPDEAADSQDDQQAGSETQSSNDSETEQASDSADVAPADDEKSLHNESVLSDDDAEAYDGAPSDSRLTEISGIESESGFGPGFGGESGAESEQESAEDSDEDSESSPEGSPETGPETVGMEPETELSGSADDDRTSGYSVAGTAPSMFGSVAPNEESRTADDVMSGTEDSNQSSGAASSEDDDAETGEEERT
ncbi:MAG: SMC-Scp complex subunit ScpB [Oleibacter sp.]|mgnify:CR=1 FL=1|nr:SMC-Scp complex subunit ScpB [Thalassolituus sp.]